MLHQTRIAARPYRFTKPRENWALQYQLNVKSAFPLLHSDVVMPKVVKSVKDYEGRKAFDEDHQLPVVGSRSSEMSKLHRFTAWEKYLNPALINHSDALPPTTEYMGRRSGYLFPSVGWLRIGTSLKFGRRTWNMQRIGWAKGTWQERNVSPKWQLAPRIAALHPDTRYQGKLDYVTLSMSRLIWALDTGRLNRNDVITLNVLLESGTIEEKEVVWPGIKLENDGLEGLKYPIHLELQNATPEAIELVEQAGGSFVATYLSIDGLYQEMRPEEFPATMTQHMPDRHGFDQVASNPRVRGFLSSWYEEEGKYAHPAAGRRLSHYVAPPHDRDYPASYEEYEHVKHHQKWHLNQPGTGTLLPWVPEYSIEAHRAPTQPL